jgi:F-type H+-transporting ATPase subunit b
MEVFLMISVDASLVVQIINFIVLIFTLNMVLYKPIRKMLLCRKEKVDGLKNQIDMFCKDTREKEEAFVSGIKQARLQGLKEKQHLVEVAIEEEKQMVDSINEKAQAELDMIRKKIMKDSEDIRISLNHELDAFADAIGQKILGRAA